MSLLILTRLQPGEQSGIIPVEPFPTAFHKPVSKENVPKGETVETVRKKDWQPVHLAEAR
jgi:hypothetical protein